MLFQSGYKAYIFRIKSKKAFKYLYNDRQIQYMGIIIVDSLWTKQSNSLIK